MKVAETEAVFLVSKITEQKEKLTKILTKYGVSEAKEIEKKIENKEIHEHPSYEDYLSAISYEDNISDLKKVINNLVMGL